MKNLILVFAVLAMGFVASAQDHVNIKNKFAAQGYDVVSYFHDNPQKGDKKFQDRHNGVAYKFVSKENLMAFQSHPEKYIPEYGGYCAYAVAKKGEKISVNPKTYLIADGKLYLFYNSWGVNTLEKWNEEGPQELTQEANKRWKDIISN